MAVSLSLQRHHKISSLRAILAFVAATHIITLSNHHFSILYSNGFVIHAPVPVPVPVAVTVQPQTKRLNSRGNVSGIDANNKRIHHGTTERRLHMFHGSKGIIDNEQTLDSIDGVNNDDYRDDAGDDANANANTNTNDNDNEKNAKETTSFVKQHSYDIYFNNMYDVLEHLETETITLPYNFRTKPKGEETKRKFQIRHMELQDVKRAVGLCLKEYGKYESTSWVSSSNSNNPIMKLIESKLDDIDNFVFSFVVLLGLSQRVERRMKSDDMSSLKQDHNVLLISEIKLDQDGNENEFIFGMAEISLKAPEPVTTSPPFVIPTDLKLVLSSLQNKGVRSLQPYVSNVLITNEYRGKGYSKLLMGACHGLAIKWGYTEVYLHVDADAKSGRAAQQLYRSLGYQPVIDKSYNENFAWMGIEMMNRGLYIVDGKAKAKAKRSEINY